MRYAPRDDMEITLHGQQLILHPQRAVIWPARKTLLIADPHFGKDDVFRRAGIALPRGPVIADLQRLTALIESEAPERLVVLGDFVHAATRAGDSFLHAFQVWRRAHAQLNVEVIAGNHDRREATDKWQGLALWHAHALIEPPFVLAHEPEAHAEGYVIAGHIHPAVRLPARGVGRVAVFWQREQALVLPSFGSFTGAALVRPLPEDKIYAVGPERIVPLRF